MFRCRGHPLDGASLNIHFGAGVSGATVAGGVTVIIDGNGHLGTVVSSERFKDQIKPIDKASETILALKPVTFHYKSDKTRDCMSCSSAAPLVPPAIHRVEMA